MDITESLFCSSKLREHKIGKEIVLVHQLASFCGAVGEKKIISSAHLLNVPSSKCSVSSVPQCSDKQERVELFLLYHTLIYSDLNSTKIQQ